MSGESKVRLPYPDDRGQTHYDGCYQMPRHHNCAVVEIERLRAALKRHGRHVRCERLCTREGCDKHGHIACTCGLDAALAGKEAPP